MDANSSAILNEVKSIDLALDEVAERYLLPPLKPLLSDTQRWEMSRAHLLATLHREYLERCLLEDEWSANRWAAATADLDLSYASFIEEATWFIDWGRLQSTMRCYNFAVIWLRVDYPIRGRFEDGTERELALLCPTTGAVANFIAAHFPPGAIERCKAGEPQRIEMEYSEQNDRFVMELGFNEKGPMVEIRRSGGNLQRWERQLS